MNWARNSWASVGLRGNSSDVGGARNCALLASCLFGRESVFPRRSCAAPTRIPPTAIQTHLLLDQGNMITIVDTVTAYAVHRVVETETAAHDQRVQNVHGYHITKVLMMERPLVVGRGQTFR